MGQLVFGESQRSSPWNTAVHLAPPAADIFIETGTCAGETLTNAVAVERFKECHSIECYRPSYFNMVKQFLHQPKAKIYFGSSPDVLPAIIDPTKPTLFWLDAHYVPDFGQYASAGFPEIDKYGQCPLLSELDAIMAFHWTAPAFILIDDAHCFTEEFWNAEADKTPQADGTILEDVVRIGEKSYLRNGLKREEWPTIDQIKAKLPRHRVEVQNNFIDIIMGFPNG